MAAGFSASLEGLVDGFQGMLIWISYHVFGLVVLAVIAAAMAAAEWFLLPDQVIVQFGVSGEHYGPKAVIVLATAALGLGGAAWLAAARAKTGLLLSVVGAAVGVVTLAINLVLF